ncbi:MAG: hypothetical protein GY851_30275 [bacterium]|nr:hypothetical protein [bacterium]
MAGLVGCLLLAWTQLPASAQDDFELRRQQLLDQYATGPSSGPYVELTRLATGRAPNEAGVLAALSQIDARVDCADFRLHGILRLLYDHADDPALGTALRDSAKLSVLGFKYWPDEPGVDSMCTWSENHHLLFSAGAYLAGQLYPDDTFTNSGQTGAELMAAHRPRVLRWLELRYRTGFSEWLSNVYYDEDLVGLVNLVDFCNDTDLALQATMVTDLLLLDMALNCYRGVFGSTHGRSYEGHKKWAASESTSDTQWLLFGMGSLGTSNMSATCLALTDRYRMPPVIHGIANDVDRPEVINRQRMGIRLEEAARWGLGFTDPEDGMVWLTLEAYSHPQTLELFVSMLDAYNWWDNAFFAPFAAQRTLIETTRDAGGLAALAAAYEKDLCRNLRDEVNIYTYRTPHYMLSSAQDYREGYGGDQQHVWQATLGANAVCFTTHPAQYTGDSPNYWTGSGWLPRVAQCKNVALVVYNAEDQPGLYVPSTLDFTHAWLPRDQFDEVIEQNGWVFARSGDGYLAFQSRNDYSWQTAVGEDQDREMLVPGRQNIYVCELGSAEESGTFAEFVTQISAATLTFGVLSVQYDSPSQGALEFDWSGAFLKDGQPVDLGDYPRYDNAYVSAEFPAGQVDVQHDGATLSLDWDAQERQVDSGSGLPTMNAPALGSAAVLMLLAARERLRRR